jgi:hypothetical protein
MIDLKATLLCKQVKTIITRNTGKTNHSVHQIRIKCIPITLTEYFLPNDQKYSTAVIMN